MNNLHDSPTTDLAEEQSTRPAPVMNIYDNISRTL